MGKKKNQSSNSILLDQFSDADLRTWNRIAELSEEYHVKLFYHLESLRTIHHEELCNALQNRPSLTLQEDNWWRFVDHEYTNSPLSAKGSIVQGARFNIGNDLGALGFKPFPVFYMAEDEETAKTEKFGVTKAANGLSNEELALRKPSSYSAVQIKFEIENVFDFTKAANLLEFTQIISKFQLTTELKKLAAELRIKPPYLVSKPSQLKRVLEAPNDWRYYPVHHEIPANSQLFGRMLRDAGYEAVLFSSTKARGKRNLGVFNENLDKSSSYIELKDKAPKSIEYTRLDSNNWKKSF